MCRRVEKLGANIPTPGMREYEPYYNSTNSVLVARSYLEFRCAVKKKAETILDSCRRCGHTFPDLRNGQRSQVKADSIRKLDSVKRERVLDNAPVDA